ncbi:MAG: hypothetical protein JKX84_03115 [Flavobacteriales bacterium]|nr:hypothetical protein [Flavobacteriales bacterium]
MKKSILIIALGVIGNTAFAQNGTKEMVNKNKLKNKLELRQSEAPLLQNATKTQSVKTVATNRSTLQPTSSRKKMVQVTAVNREAIQKIATQEKRK